MIGKCLQAVLLFFAVSPYARGQQTVFNVPSADVLQRGAVYTELDLLSYPNSPSFAITPRIVVGVGRRVEVGINLLGISEPSTGQYTLSPAIKWKFYDGGDNSWAAIAGDNVYIPVRERGYDLGSYGYIAVAKTLGTRTRITAGGCLFTPHVVADASRAGGQFAFEYKISPSVTVATDWFTGKHSSGAVTTGVIWNATPHLAIYAAYSLGNAGVAEGNHGPLVEIGWSY